MKKMKVLFLAPHPFFQERGTPIDDLLILRVLATRDDVEVDMVSYHEGTDIEIPGVTFFRTRHLPFIKNIRPGFSMKKLVCDVFLFFKAGQLIRKKRYDLIHAVEEAGFIALFFRLLNGTQYIFDMDSSISQQLVESRPFLKIFSPFFDWMEGLLIRNSIVNFPVCNALADFCKTHGSKKTVTVHDISQLPNPGAPRTGRLKKELKIQGLLILYAGNLEPYQGIDLLLESFSLLCKRTESADLIIIGGVEEDIELYAEKANHLEIAEKTHFLGPKKFDLLGEFLAESDILTVPRIRGVNTPMKIFPFLHSGRPVIATKLPTHTQLLSDKEVLLAPADPEGFCEGLFRLVTDSALREKLGKEGYSFVEKNHTFPAHKRRVDGAYDWIIEKMGEEGQSLEVIK